MLTGGRVMASGDVHTVMTAPMISRLYQTPTRRVETNDGDVIFVPKITDGTEKKKGTSRWT
jgi:iron complex transport system ATP-binding protein